MPATTLLPRAVFRDVIARCSLFRSTVASHDQHQTDHNVGGVCVCWGFVLRLVMFSKRQDPDDSSGSVLEIAESNASPFVVRKSSGYLRGLLDSTYGPEEPLCRATGRRTHPRSRCTNGESANDPAGRTGSHQALTPQPHRPDLHPRSTTPHPN